MRSPVQISPFVRQTVLTLQACRTGRTCKIRLSLSSGLIPSELLQYYNSIHSLLKYDIEEIRLGIFSWPIKLSFDTESWISPQSALLTVLTRDLYPPPCELVARPPKDTDLEKYYAVFLPKNLSDDYAEDVADIKASSIPSLLGRSASTESLHKDRLDTG